MANGIARVMISATDQKISEGGSITRVATYSLANMLFGRGESMERGRVRKRGSG